MHVVEALAYNATKRALQRTVEEADLIEISGWQSCTRNLSSWESFAPLTPREKAAQRSVGPTMATPSTR